MKKIVLIALAFASFDLQSASALLIPNNLPNDLEERIDKAQADCRKRRSVVEQILNGKELSVQGDINAISNALKDFKGDEAGAFDQLKDHYAYATTNEARNNIMRAIEDELNKLENRCPDVMNTLAGRAQMLQNESERRGAGKAL